MSLENIKRLLQVHAWEQTVVCPPEIEQKVIDALSEPEFHGKFKIITSSLIPEGKVYVINDDAVEKAWRDMRVRYPLGILA